MGTNEGGSAAEKKVVMKEEKWKVKYFERNYDQWNDDDDQKGVVKKKEKFHGACADLQGHVFEAGVSCVNQTAKYDTTFEHIKTYVCQWYYPILLGTIKKMQDISLFQP